MSYAFSELPNNVEELLNCVYCYLKYNSNRKQSIQELQEHLNIPEKKTLKLQKVRWLTLQAVVDRFVDVLFKYFENESADHGKIQE